MCNNLNSINFDMYVCMYVCFFSGLVFFQVSEDKCFCWILVNSFPRLTCTYSGCFNVDPKRWNALTTWQGLRCWILIESFSFSSKREIAVPLFCCFTSLNSVNVYWSMLSFVQSVASWVKWVVVYRGLPTKRCIARPKPIKDVPRPCPLTPYNVRPWASWLRQKILKCLKYEALKICMGSEDRSTRAEACH